MKRIFRNDKVLNTHLADLIDRITHIIICGDIFATYGMIASSTSFENDGEDMSDEQFYLTFTDENLLELSDDEIHKISSIELLGRIARQDYNRLSAKQKLALRKAYGKKVIVDESDIQDLLNKLQKCNSISYERRHRKTELFLCDASGVLRESDCLEIIHQLAVGDYVATSKSYNPNHIGNELFIFEPEADWEANDGTILENLKIYVKLDIDETTKTAVALVSMHEAEYDDPYPYRS